MNETINVTMNGKEFIAYKERRRIKIPKNIKKALPYFIGVLCGILIIALLFESITYKPSNFTYTWEGIGMFLAICAGLGWIFHGTGFLLVRR